MQMLENPTSKTVNAALGFRGGGDLAKETLLILQAKFLTTLQVG